MGALLGPKYVMYKYTGPFGSLAAARMHNRKGEHGEETYKALLDMVVQKSTEALHIRGPHVRRPFGDLRDYRAAQDMSF